MAQTKRDQHTKQEHIDLMAANGKGWPVRPFLPLMRRRKGEAEFAVLISGKRWDRVLVEANLVEAMMAYGHYGERVTAKEFVRWAGQFPQRRFDSFEAIYRAGWRVD